MKKKILYFIFIIFSISSLKSSFLEKYKNQLKNSFNLKKSFIVGIPSIIFLQILNPKSIPFLRVFSLFKKYSDESTEKNISRIAKKIARSTTSCELIRFAKERFNDDGSDLTEEKKINLFRLFNQLCKNEENLFEIIKKVINKEKFLKTLHPNLNEHTDLVYNFREANALEQCILDDTISAKYKEIIKAESIFLNNFIYFFSPYYFYEKIKFLTLIGESQFAITLLTLLLSYLNKDS